MMSLLILCVGHRVIYYSVFYVLDFIEIKLQLAQSAIAYLSLFQANNQSNIIRSLAKVFLICAPVVLNLGLRFQTYRSRSPWPQTYIPHIQPDTQRRQNDVLEINNILYFVSNDYS